MMNSMTVNDIFKELENLATDFETADALAYDANRRAEDAYDAYNSGDMSYEAYAALENAYRELINEMFEIYDKAWDMLDGIYGACSEYYHIWNYEDWIEKALSEHGLYYVKPEKLLHI